MSRSISHIASNASSSDCAESNVAAKSSKSEFEYCVLFESPRGSVQKNEQWNVGNAAFPSEYPRMNMSNGDVYRLSSSSVNTSDTIFVKSVGIATRSMPISCATPEM